MGHAVKRRVYIWSGVAVFVAAGFFLPWFLLHWYDCPRPWNLGRYVIFVGPPPQLSVTYLGASSLLIHDGSQGILIDGFFTRPTGIFIQPDQPPAIDAALNALHITTTDTQRQIQLRAVIVNHSHFDHAMDSPLVAQKTSATLVGSSSTANIAAGLNFTGLFRPIDNGNGSGEFCFGNFGVTTIKTDHVRFNNVILAGGDITAPLTPGLFTNVGDYKEGGTYAVFVRYRNARKMLIQGSAGFVVGALLTHQADVAFIAVGGLGHTSNVNNREPYWHETVEAVDAKRVFLIHWDDLGATVDWSGGPQEPGVETDTQAGLDFMLGKNGAQRTVSKLKILDPVDPYPPP